MRKILKDQEIVESPWTLVDETQTLPDGPVIVPWRRWRQEKESLQDRSAPVAFCLDGADDPRETKDDLQNTPLVAILFPKFADGRGYSHARILREELQYTGELRAVGDILRDQLFYLARCGFNAFEIREDKDLQEALEGLKDFSVSYQAAADQPLPLYRRR